MTKEQKKVLYDLRYLEETLSHIVITLKEDDPLSASDLWQLSNHLQTLVAAVVILQNSVTRLTVELEKSEGIHARVNSKRS